ncbi:radial spoke head protein 9 homolog [Tubulanus polymorphus]|uniref:radial spoke head protein 9 homolog n=1 Tax=Tubulanus polymorphus TaxID=672921 RepID=UPI003DA32681
MDSVDLHLAVDYVGSSGAILNPEQKAALMNSLVILKDENKFHKVYFWGKILGIKDNYFIAQGVSSDELADRKTFYSKDCTKWGLLAPATQAMREQSKLAKGRFIGDPSYEYEHTEIKKTADGEETQEEEETITIKEEDRLASVIAEIGEDVFIIPRGAFVKQSTGEVQKNRCFEGLNVTEAAKLGSYFHFRDAVNLNKKSLLERADLDKGIDFLDSLEDDEPKGSWSLQFEKGSGLVILRSLLWLGYVFYHVPGMNRFGSVYVGTGEINKDLPFAL